MTNTQSNKRIAKNTLFLYIRMLFVMGVTLFTSRIILDKLGVQDYGIYNAVGGVVTMLSCLTSTLSTGTSRFLTFELGKNDIVRLKHTFSTAFYAHLILALIVALFMETIGLWFLYNKLIIPEERLMAAVWTFHISVLTAMVSITQVPYTSIIIAHENMNVYAYLGIFEAAAKLLVVYLLVISDGDRLVYYAIFVAIVQVIIAMFYRFYCIKQYGESRVQRYLDKTILRNMLSYSGLSLVANISQILSTQGLVVLINMFFQPAVVAAQALGNQISNAIMQFVSNLMTAINPQIIKLYAAGEYEASRKLTLQSSVYIHELILLFSLPAIVVMDTLLHIWLVEVPPYAVIFAQYIILRQIFSVYNYTLYVPMMASGKLGSNSWANVWCGIGGIVILYIILKIGGDVMWVQYISIVQAIIFSYIVKPYILCREIGYHWSEIFSSFFHCLKVSVIPVVVSVICSQFIEVSDFIIMMVVIVVICVSVALSTYIFLNKETKAKLFEFIRSRFHFNKAE